MLEKVEVWLQNLRYLEPKLTSSLRKGYSISHFRSDVLAGIFGAIISFPLSMALAVASNTSPVRGLYAAIVGGLIISLLGGSRTQIAGPASGFVVVIATIMERYGIEGLLLATLMAGIMLIIAGIARLGFIIRYVPYPVIAGFTSGLGIVMLATQLRDFLGLNIDKVPAQFLGAMRVYFETIHSYNPPTVIIGVAVVAAIWIVRHAYPKIPILPVTIFVSSFIVWFWNLPVATIGSKYGVLPTTIPLPHLPPIYLDRLIDLLPEATTIAFLAGIEALLCAVLADSLTGDRHRSNAELLAQGIANVVSPLFGGIPVTSAFSRTTTNIQAGAKTPIAGIVHAIAILLFMVALLPLISHVPLVTMAAILITIAVDMLEIQRFMRIAAGSKGDALLIITTFGLTVLSNITVAIQAGIVLASLLFVQRMGRLTQITPQEAGIPPNGETPAGLVGDALSEGNIFEGTLPEGVCLYHINGPFFFGAASRLRAVLEQIRTSTKVYILNLAKVPLIDATGAQVIAHFTEKCHRRGIEVILCGLNSHSREVLSDFGIDQLVPRRYRVANVSTAIRLAEEIIKIEHESGLTSA